jgi:hypothetical protein
LEVFGHPYVKTDQFADSGDLKADVLLPSPALFELFAVAQDTMEAGEHLFGGKLFLIVGLRDLEDKEAHLGGLDVFGGTIVSPGQIPQDRNKRNPDIPLEQ